MNFYQAGLGLIVALIMAFLLTPNVKRLAFKIGAIDKPNARKVHTRIMPRLGGLAIFLAFVVSFLLCYFLFPAIDRQDAHIAWGLLTGGAIIVVIGALDDKMELSAKVKLLGQIVAACVVVFGFDLKVNLLNVPFGDTSVNLEWLSVPITIFWIVGVTNAINLIDGLDGLAAGVSGIATATIMVMALLMGNFMVFLLCAVLLGSIIGFLFFNFHPAKIFMGDSGSLFLGFSLATLSLLGFKQVTLVSFVVPLFIIGVPLSDTFYAIIRRWVNKKPIFAPDKGHLHHCLRELGFSHRKTVLIIYSISTFFGLCAIVLSQSTQWVALVLVGVILFVLQVGAEIIGIVSKGRKPVLHFLHRLRMSINSNANNSDM